MGEEGVASIGECMLEMSGRPDGSWNLGYAGDTFNTLWAVRALTGKPCDYISAFGDDPFSEKQTAFFRDNGIGIASSPRITGARPGLYAITLTGAERSFTYWRNDAAARQLACDPVALARSLENRALIYFSGITLAILAPDARKVLLAAIGKARAKGAKIAFDPNYRPRLWASAADAKAAIAEALGLADMALPTFPDEQALFGDRSPEETAQRLRAADVAEVVVKDGEKPATISYGARVESVAAMHVHVPVDTTGAGDSFNGAYLAARLGGSEPAEATRKAHRVAAAVVQVRGALAPFEMLGSAFAGE